MAFEEEMNAELKPKRDEEGKVDLEDYCTQLKKRTDRQNHAINQICWPYARGGSKPEFARMIQGWTGLYAIAGNWILEAQKLVQSANEQPDDATTLDVEPHNIETLIYFMHGNLQKYIWKDGNYILGVCFMDEDVSPAAATVIQTMIPTKGQVPSFFEEGLGPTTKSE